MSNVCMDTVIFYAEDELFEDGLQEMKKAVETCYPEGRPYCESNMSKLFEYLEISTENIHVRGDLIDHTIEDSYIRLEFDSAWNPMKEAYDILASRFDLEMVFMAEESGCDLYYNTDENGLYLSTSYKAVLSDRPDDGSLDELYEAADGDTDFYFDSEKDMLQWFREKGKMKAANIAELRELVDSDYISIHEYTNPY